MKYCSNCGTQLNENQEVCLQCGKVVGGGNKQVVGNDTGGFAFGLLGFCVPIIGLILFLIWKDEKPLSAKAAGKGALISVITYFLLIIIYVIIAIAIIGSAVK